MKDKTVWYEVRVNGGSNNFYTLKEAKDYQKDMSNGFIEKHTKMEAENREYWKKASKRAEIWEVTQVSKKII
jgi:hypothetical protein